MVDELAPASGEKVPPRRAAVDVAEVPNDAVQVSDGERLNRWLCLVVERREDGVGAEPRDGETAAIVSIRRSQDLGEGDDPVAVVFFFFLLRRLAQFAVGR